MRRIFIVFLSLFSITQPNADIEPANNAWQTAEVLLKDNSVSGTQSDNDWYLITITSSQNVKRILIDLTFTHADGNIDLEIWGDDFVVSDPTNAVPGLDRGGSAGRTTDHEFIDAKVVPTSPATYYIQVTGDNSGNSYTLTWTELGSADDGFEQNDSRLASQPVAESAVAFGVQSDDDWYSINVSPGHRRLVGSLRFFNTEFAATIDMNLELTDASGTVIASSINGPGINEAIDQIVPSPGTYHLKVSGDNRADGYALDWLGMNEAPQAIANTVNTTEDVPYHFSVGDFTFSDNEGDGLVSATLSNLSLGGGSLTHSGGTAVDTGGTLMAGQLNTLIYTPPADATGNPLATFDFTVNDADTGITTAQMAVNVTAATGGTNVSSGAIAPFWLLVFVTVGLFRIWERAREV